MEIVHKERGGRASKIKEKGGVGVFIKKLYPFERWSDECKVQACPLHYLRRTN